MGGLFSGPKTPKVPKQDLGQDISQYVEGYTEALPGLLKTEGEYRPQFQGLNLADVNTFLMGTGDQMGILGLAGEAQRQAGVNINDARRQDLEAYLGMAPQFRGFAQALSPEAASQVTAASAEADRASQSARGMTWEEERDSQQAARQAFSSRGMLDSNSSVAGEILNRQGAMANKRAEAANARGNAFGMAQSFYTAPGLQMMGSNPLAYQAGQQQLGMGLGAIGAARPQMINPDVGVNAGMADDANRTAAAGAAAQAQAGYSSGIFGALGTIGGAALKFSDASLKSDISPTGETTRDGIPIYTYRYHGDKQKYRGVMAQDVQRIRPDAVGEVDGYLAVDYSKL